MSRFARVTSIGVLPLAASAMQKFRSEASSAMDDLEAEIRRALEWIHHDRKEYWAQELRRSYEAVTQARIQLQQARISRRVAGNEPACIDEQRALERARRRLETAEQKVKAVRHWANAIDRAAEEFQQNRTRFVTWLDTDLLRAVTALNRMSESLASYTSLEAPADSGIAAGPADAAASDSGAAPPQDAAAPDSAEGTGVQLPSQPSAVTTPDAAQKEAGR